MTRMIKITIKAIESIGREIADGSDHCDAGRTRLTDATTMRSSGSQKNKIRQT